MASEDSDAEPIPPKAWLGVFAVAAGIFLLVTTEILPIGLLTSISDSLDVTDGTSGLLITVPGFIAAFSAPTVAMAAGEMDRRTLLCILIGLVFSANLLSALAPGFTVLLISRVLVGIGIGGFWAIAASLGPRLTGDRNGGQATAIIFAGVAVASLVGVPLATALGDAFGWRVAFGGIGLLALVVLSALVILLPNLPATQRIDRRVLSDQLANSAVRLTILATLLVVAGHFAAYTFVRPFLEQVSGFAASWIGPLLLLFGAAGIGGNFLAGRWAAGNEARTLILVIGAMALSMLAIPFVGANPLGAVAMLAIWGTAYGGLAVTLQSWIFRIAPTSTEATTSLFAATFNFSIATGSLLGGRAVDELAPSGAMMLGGALALTTVVVLWRSILKGDANPVQSGCLRPNSPTSR